MASEAFSGHSETLHEASRAAYYAATAALDNLGDEEAAFLWAHRAIKLSKLSGDTYPWIGDCWVMVGRAGVANGMAEATEGAFKTGLKLQAQLAGEVPEANFNLSLGLKHYADYLDNTSRQGEALIALGEATRIVATIPPALRGYPEIVAIVAAYHSRCEPG
jgi:tetratricopeptide (TPR) repeat protein